MNVLLIWEGIPSCATVYLLKDITGHAFNLLKCANGNYINGEDMTDEQEFALNAISAAISDAKYTDDILYKDYAGKWVGDLIETGKLIDNVQYVFQCGFFE